MQNDKKISENNDEDDEDQSDEDEDMDDDEEEDDNDVWIFFLKMIILIWRIFFSWTEWSSG